MATSYEDFSTIHYQGREYYVVYIDPQNMFYGGSMTDDYGNVISGELKQDYTPPEGDQIGEDGQDKRPPESLRDGTTPEKALASFPDDLRCPIMPRTRHLTKELLNNMNASEEAFSIPTSAYFDGNKYGVCYLIRRTDAYTGSYTNAQRKTSPAINYDVPLYPHNETYSAQRDRNVPYSLRNIMFLGCPKETDELWYLLPDELKLIQNGVHLLVKEHIFTLISLQMVIQISLKIHQVIHLQLKLMIMDIMNLLLFTFKIQVFNLLLLTDVTFIENVNNMIVELMECVEFLIF